MYPVLIHMSLFPYNLLHH